MLKLLTKYLKPYRGQVLLILFLLFLQTLTNLFLPNLMSRIVDYGVTNGDTPYIFKLGVIMLILALFGAVFVVFANLHSAKVSMKLSRDLRLAVFSQVESFNLFELNQVGTSSLITRTTNDITQIQQVVLMALRMMVTAPLVIIGGLIMALSTDVELSIVLVIAIPLLIAVIAIVGGRGVPLFRAIQSKIDAVNLVSRENLTGVRVIRAFNRVAFEHERFTAANRDLTDNAIRVNKIIAILMPSMNIIFNLTTVAIIALGGIRVDALDLQVGSLMAFVQYIMQIMLSLVMLTMVFIMIPRAAASASRIQEVLGFHSSIEDGTAHPEGMSALSGHIAFKDVSFTYPGSHEPALSHISFTTKPGQITAIIGGTGSGKSTLLNLIPRFYDVSSGSICLNNMDIQDLSLEELRGKIGLVPQKALLFSGTLRENLRYGKDDATNEDLWHALAVAQGKSFVEEKEGTLDTYVAQGGTNFSGGQKQRLCIARAIVRKPEVYLFDDSFSALDFKTDLALREALKDETKHAATLIIGQRVTSIMHADEILVLHEGHVVGKGTHKELLKSCDMYREIALSQLSKEEIDNA